MASCTRKLVGTALLVVIVGILGVGIASAQVSVTNPADGTTVRGTVEIVASKPATGEGWISYKVLKQGENGDFQAAIIAPYKYTWDTRARDDKGQRLYPDGAYEITAAAFGPSGEALGTATSKVTVQNDVAGADNSGAILLRPGYKREQMPRFHAVGRAKARIGKEDADKVPVDIEVQARLDARWRQQILAPSVTGEAILDTFADEGYYEIAGSKPDRLDGVGKVFRIRVETDDIIRPMHRKSPKFEMGMMYVGLPDKPVNVGDTWRSDVAIMPVLEGSKRRVFQADNRLDGFESVAGQKCARIVSKLSEQGAQFDIRLPNSKTEAKSSYTGERISYFSLDTGMFVAFRDHVKHKMEVDLQKLQSFAQGGMGGAGGTGGMPGMPGMGGGMPGMPGMGGGMPGMPGMGGGMPGMPGMGGGMPGMPGMGGAPTGMPGMPGMGGGMPGMGGMAGGASGGMAGGMGAAAPTYVHLDADVWLDVTLEK